MNIFHFEEEKTEKIKVFWIIFLTSLLIVSFIILTIKKIYCFDIWWHLATGKLIWEKHIIPHKDYFSYTFNGQPWIDSQWFFQAVIYKIYEIFGYNGLIIFKSFIIGLSLFFLYKTLRLGNIPLETSIVLILLTLWATSFRFSIRPHLATYLFVSIFWYLLLKIKETRKVRPFQIISLLTAFIIWLNCHGSFIIGIVLAGFFLLEIIIKKRNLSTKEVFQDKEIKKFAFISTTLLIASLINPYGWKLLNFVLFSHTKNDATKFILEWQPLNIKTFLSLTWNKEIFTKIIIIVILSGIVYNTKNIIRAPEKGIWIIWLCALALLAIKYIRFLGLFCFGCLPLLNIFPLNYRNTYTKYLLSISAVITLVFCLNYIKKPIIKNNLGMGIIEENYPIDIVNFIKREKLPKPLFNDYATGGFIIWKLYPDYLVFIDGRTPSLYSPNFYWQYRMTREHPKLIFNKIKKKYKFQTIITSDPKFVSFLKKRKFKLLGFENHYYLLSEANNLRYKSLEIYDPGKEFNHLINDIDTKEKKLLIKELIYTAKTFPHNAKAFNLLGALYLSENPKKSLDYFKKALKLRPFDENILANIGIAYYNNKEYLESYLYLKRSLKINKKKPETLKYLARTCYKLKKYKEGLKYIKKYFDIQKDPTDKTDYEYMGLLLYENNKFKQAIDYFKRSLFLEKDKKNKANLLYNIGNCYLAIGQDIKAKKYYQQALKLDRNHRLAQKALEELKNE